MAFNVDLFNALNANAVLTEKRQLCGLPSAHCGSRIRGS
jgi:hypothetical protein